MRSLAALALVVALVAGAAIGAAGAASAACVAAVEQHGVTHGASGLGRLPRPAGRFVLFAGGREVQVRPPVR